MIFKRKAHTTCVIVNDRKLHIMSCLICLKWFDEYLFRIATEIKNGVMQHDKNVI